MKLSHLSVKNFKSLQNVSCENISDFHTFIGKNSTGKSTVFEAINLIKQYHNSLENSHELVSGSITDVESKTISVVLDFDIDDQHREEYFSHYFGVGDDQLTKFLESSMLKQIKIVIEINVYGNKITNKTNSNKILVSHLMTYDAHENPFIILQRLDKPHKIRVIPIQRSEERNNVDLVIDDYLHTFGSQDINSDQNLSNDWLPQRIISDITSSLREISTIRESKKKTQIETIENEAQVDLRGSNLLNLMDTMFTNKTKRYFEVEKFCTKIFPDLESIRPKHLLDNKITLVVKKKNLPYEINLQDEGSGLEQLLIIIWKIATSDSETIWMLEEPELHLHPGAEKLLYDFLREETEKGKQILVTTHSMVFIHKSSFEDITLLLPNEGFTAMTLLSGLVSAESKKNENARDVIYQALEYDPTFALESKTAVIVEGKTDEMIIKEFARILGRNPDEKSVIFIPIGDKSKVKKFSPILIYALSGKNSIIILDNDKEDPKNIKQNVLDHAETFQKTSGINKAILSDENFFLYPKEIRSIEDYLLQAEAIAKAGDNPSKIQEVKKQIEADLSKPLEHRARPKEFLSNLWENIGFGPYSETDTAVKIASKIERHELESHPEIVELVDKIFDHDED